MTKRKETRRCALLEDGTRSERMIPGNKGISLNGSGVIKKPFVADFIGGIGMIIHRRKITYSSDHRTKEFETRKGEQNFGANLVSFTF